jgi:hypothetical protein
MSWAWLLLEEIGLKSAFAYFPNAAVGKMPCSSERWQARARTE